MAEIVLGIGASHGGATFSPPSEWGLQVGRDRRKASYAGLLANASPDLAAEVVPEKLQERYQAGQRAQAVLNDVVARVAPDLIVMFGDDQQEQFLDDNMPMFCVYRGATLARGARVRARDASAAAVADSTGVAAAVPATERQGAPEFAEYLIRWLVDAEIDVAVSNELKADIGLGHAFTHVSESMPAIGERAILPFMVNTYYPPNQPTATRCYNLGKIIREAIEAWDSNTRVAIMASGGLSHNVIDEKLDRGVLDVMSQANAEEVLTAIPQETFEGGTSEILNWITLAGATQSMTKTVIDYIPAYRTPAGTGLAMAFAYFI